MSTPVAPELDFLRRLARLAAMLEARLAGEEMPPPSSEEVATSIEAGGPFMALATELGLSAFDVDLLHLAAGAVIDDEFRSLVAAASHRRDGLVRVGFAIALLIRDPAQRLAIRHNLAGHAPLFANGFLRPIDGAFPEAILRPTSRALAALLQENPMARLPSFAGLRGRRDFGEVPAGLSADSIAEVMRNESDRGSLVIVTGNAGVGRSTRARAILSSIAEQWLEIDASRAWTRLDRAELGSIVTELIGDAFMVGLPVLLDDADEVLGADGAVAVGLRHLLEREAGIVVVVVRDEARVHPLLRSRALLVDRVVLPCPEQRARIWSTCLGETPGGLDGFELDPSRIRAAAAFVRHASLSAPVAAGLQMPGADNLLLPESGKMSLGDLVLCDETREEVEEFLAAVKSRTVVMRDWGMGARLTRGRGLSALFDGDPGTGKTLAAEVIANEVGLPLMTVNVASVVDKYVGETEKNLSRVFREARTRAVILLFDEADALFGQRVQVSGAQDRFANLEINLLLQLMESHDGIVMLTTNLKRGLDPAFMRRIGYRIHFEPPDEEQRERLWRVHLPAQQMDESVDPEALAVRFSLTGGGVKNVVVRGCYRAAAAGRKLSMADLVECAQLESHAMGKVSM